MQKIATGWLKWKPDEFEYALLPDILIAYEGHIDELKAIHGSGEKTSENADVKKIDTAQDFLAFFGNKGVKKQ